MIMFGTSCWYLWKWRNAWIFEGKYATVEGKLNAILSFASVIVKNCGKIGNGIEILESRKEEILVDWIAPPHGWLTLNSRWCF